jgi:hypothetical protein
MFCFYNDAFTFLATCCRGRTIGSFAQKTVAPLTMDPARRMSTQFGFSDSRVGSPGGLGRPGELLSPSQRSAAAAARPRTGHDATMEQLLNDLRVTRNASASHLVPPDVDDSEIDASSLFMTRMTQEEEETEYGASVTAHDIPGTPVGAAGKSRAKSVKKKLSLASAEIQLKVPPVNALEWEGSAKSSENIIYTDSINESELNQDVADKSSHSLDASNNVSIS